VRGGAVFLHALLVGVHGYHHKRAHRVVGIQFIERGLKMQAFQVLAIVQIQNGVLGTRGCGGGRQQDAQFYLALQKAGRQHFPHKSGAGKRRAGAEGIGEH